MGKAGARQSVWLDAVAIGASLACLVHCLVLPLLLALVPALARAIAVPESFHRAALLFAIPASAWAMRAGYRHHSTALPALFGAIGLLLLVGGALGGFDLAIETGVTVIGSLMLASAHWVNWSLQRRMETRHGN
jgi:hypothetical protein